MKNTNRANTLNLINRLLLKKSIEKMRDEMLESTIKEKSPILHKNL